MQLYRFVVVELYLWRMEKKTWITFKYERLPNICYWCGRLDHNDRDCEIWLESEGSLTKNQKQFGPSLHAPPFSPARRSVMAVPGFYTPKRKSVTPPASETRHEQRDQPTTFHHQWRSRRWCTTWQRPSTH